MSRYKVELTDVARRDMRNEVLFLVNEVFSEQAATRLTKSLRSKLQLLAAQPEAFPLVRNRGLAELGYRWTFLEHQMLFYVVDEANHVVTVDRILPRRADWMNALGDGQGAL